MTISTLIVEDDPMVAEVNRNFVESITGYEVVGVVSTGGEALALIENLRPALTLLDVYLPDIDGVSVLHEIRKRQLPTDVILITAAQDVMTIQDVFRYGAIDYIVKPFKLTRLKSALDLYVNLRESLDHCSSLDQDAIDKLTRGQTAEHHPSRLPKGLHELTLRQIYVYLVQQGRSLSADEVAAGVGLARVTARRYLEYLERNGKVALELQYGSVGRPVNRYRIRDHKD
ncbi:response regulator [Desulforudis sp. 1088]|uniref:response regulator n=1 Tax=unclassified Candidatus Desulforudis TaxID=2635950 RepID=UPI0034923062